MGLSEMSELLQNSYRIFSLKAFLEGMGDYLLPDSKLCLVGIYT